MVLVLQDLRIVKLLEKLWVDLPSIRKGRHRVRIGEIHYNQLLLAEAKQIVTPGREAKLL